MVSGCRFSVVNKKFSIVLAHKAPSKIIISVPHDVLLVGDFEGQFALRQNGVKVRDVYVWPIANDVIRVCRESSLRVDAVRFLMSRACVDANRSFQSSDNAEGEYAFEDPALASVYQYYHGQLSRLIRRAVRRFGKEQVFLLDMHGFGTQPEYAPERGYDLILGSGNRTTILHGKVDCSFAWFMEKRGYSVFLPVQESIVAQGDTFNGGHIVRFYAEIFGINALQIEIASRFRGRSNKEDGERLAGDIAEFLISEYRY